MAEHSQNFEDLPFSVRKARAETEFIKKNFAIGHYLDSLDNTSSWCVGIVKNIINDTIQIKYDGWGEKYDTVF